MLVNKTSGHQFSLESLLFIYAETYPLSNKLGEESLYHSDLSYHSQTLVMLTSFLGLPNHKRLDDQFTFTDLLKNMLDLNVKNEKNSVISALDKILAVPMFLYHLIRMVITIPVSIVKIVTEFLPGMAEEACRIAAENTKDKTEDSFKHGAANFGYRFFSVLQYIGRAATSPFKSFFIGMDKDSGGFWTYLSLFTSSLIYGIPLGMTAAILSPLYASLSIGMMLSKTVGLSIAFSAISACLVMLGAILNSVSITTDGFIKETLHAIGESIWPSKSEKVTAQTIPNSLTGVHKVIPIEANKKDASITSENTIINSTTSPSEASAIKAANDNMVPIVEEKPALRL